MNNVTEIYSSLGEIKEPTWLNGRSYSGAFIICVSAGPWRFGRRKTIQGQSLDKLNGRDLSELTTDECINFYPLDWQNKFLNCINAACNSKKAINSTFETYCSYIKTYTNPISISNVCKEFYSYCGSSGAKVLSLFIRDSLKFDCCFPVDRWVKRYLIENNLPTTEENMISLCLENEINPRLFAIGIAQKMGVENPDWSIK